MDVLSGIRTLALPVLTATLLGCVEQQGLAGPETLDAEAVAAQRTPISDAAGMNLEDRAHNHLVCMSAYASAINPCVDMAANQTTADEINEGNADIKEEGSLADGFFGTVTADAVGSACIGRLTDDVFGDANAARNMARGTASLPSDNRPERPYDWTEDGLGEQVQSAIDRIYAQPDTEAPEWLERPVGRLVGHAHYGASLLTQAGYGQDKVDQIVRDYGADGSYELIGRHPNEQDNHYKIKACVELL